VDEKRHPRTVFEQCGDFFIHLNRISAVEEDFFMRWIKGIAVWGLAACLGVMSQQNALAEEDKLDEAKEQEVKEFVVTATRLKRPIEEVGSSITVITHEDIKTRGYTSVFDVLREVPSLDVVQNGGQGAITSVFIRGAKSEHTLVLVDGVEANNPVTTGRTFNFANLNVTNIERIEVLRGPQSVLYGSDAIGGVVNIITKKGKGPFQSRFGGEYGSFRTWRANANVSGGSRFMNYAVGISHMDTEGISAASDKESGNKEKDGYENTTFSARVGLTPFETLDVDVILRYVDASGELDNGGGANQDDPNYDEDTQTILLRTAASLSLFDGFWEQVLGVSFSRHDRDTINGKDSDHPLDSAEGVYDSSTRKLDWQHHLYLHESNILTIGAEYEREDASSTYESESMWGPFSSEFGNETSETKGLYVQDQISLMDTFFAAVGVRTDNHSRFGSKTTYRVAPACVIRKTGTRLKGSYGTGYKAPSLFQLFSSYGDEDLKPEKSIGWDAGFEQSFWKERVSFGLTYFDNHYKTMIDFDSGLSLYQNIGEATSSGTEVFAAFQPVDFLSLRAAYTHTNTKDTDTGEQLLRRPKKKYTCDVDVRFLEKGNLHLTLLHVGERQDMDYSTWPASHVTLDSYTVVNLSASFQAHENVRVFGRVDNLLDEAYEQVLGYGTKGTGVYAGAEITF